MDILRSKLHFMKDLSIEYKSSLSSIQFVRDNYETMLDHLESEIAQRNFEKQHFMTKTGLTLRDLLLQHYNILVHQIHASYCLNEELFTHMLSQQSALHDMINHTEPLMHEMDSLTLFTSQKNLKHCMLKTSIGREKQMIRGHNLKEQYQTKASQSEQNSCKYRLKFLKIEVGNQNLLEVSEKVWKTQVRELNNLVDQCLTSLGDMYFIRQKISSQSCKKSPKQKTFTNNADTSSLFTLNKHFGSTSYSQTLGLASREEEINFHCDENIDHMLVSQSEVRLTEGLSQINQHDQFQYSEDFTPKKVLDLSFSEKPLQ